MNLIEEKSYLRAKPKNLKECDSWIFEKEYERKIPTVEIIHFSKVTVLPELIVLKNYKIVQGVCTRAEYKKGANTFIKNIRKKKVKLLTAILLIDKWSVNYFHWFTDALPRLFIAEKYYPGVPIVIPAYFDQFPYIIESLKAFSKLEIIWLRNYQKLKIKKLIYIPHTAPTGNYNEELIKEVSNKLINHFALKDIIVNKKVMISRQAAPNRKITNIHEVRPIFQKANIEEVVFEKHTWKEQVGIAAKTNILLGVHGAGLTNMLFMKPGTKILEFRRKGDNKNNCYFSLASALNIDYYYLLCDVDDYTKITQQNNFYVNKIELEKNLMLMFN